MEPSPAQLDEHGHSERGKRLQEGGPGFQATQWSVLALAAQSNSPGALRALDDLCRAYWQPLCRFIQAQGASETDAQDLTQVFLVNFINNKSLIRADPLKGRFRNFLLSSLKNFLHDEWDKRNAARRGGGQLLVSLDATHVPSFEPANRAVGDAHFDKSWAITLLDRAISEIRHRWEERGKLETFQALECYLAGTDETDDYANAAEKLGVSIPAVTALIHRLRKEYREILRAEVGRTVSDPQAINAELRHLCLALTT
ncbi:MAG TPA: hypothetical protein VIT91_16775 [Chthoniobacterales bacterium]